MRRVGRRDPPPRRLADPGQRATVAPDTQNDSLHPAALNILRAGVAAADPERALLRALRLEDDCLRVGDSITLDVASVARMFLVGAGKAAAVMAAAALDLLGDRVSGGSFTVTGGGPVTRVANFDVWEGGHPIPDVVGLAGASEALALARAAGAEDLVLCLLSGGASSLWPAPAAGLTLSDLQAATRALLRSGAPIEAVNTVRRHLSSIAGGGLARAARPARVLTLAISDVIGGTDADIGSGPTLPDPTTYADALEVVDRFDVVLPAATLHHLRVGAGGGAVETAKAGELDNLLGFAVILSVADAIAGAEAEARRLGYRTRVISAGLGGEAREVGVKVAAEALRARAGGEGPVALIWGGETTVTVRGEGRGGRNQELALAAAVALRNEAGVLVAAMGTDGRDGPTDAAGGMVDGGTVARGVSAGLDAAAHLHSNDAYAYLRATHDLICTGPTGTNVNDLVVALVSHSGAG
jgi:glycerate 2-kinase